MKKDIIINAELPPQKFSENYRKPPVPKSKYTEEERAQRKKEAQAKWNAKNRTPEFNKKHNDRQRAINSPSYQASIQKAYKKKIIAYAEKLEELAGRAKPLNCEICNDDGKICFDHCHTNHHFRGWICDRCNKVLGLVKDNIETLQLLQNYIKADKEKLS